MIVYTFASSFPGPFQHLSFRLSLVAEYACTGLFCQGRLIEPLALSLEIGGWR